MSSASQPLGRVPLPVREANNNGTKQFPIKESNKERKIEQGTYEREREGHWSDKQGEIVRSAHTLSYMHL